MPNFYSTLGRENRPSTTVKIGKNHIKIVVLYLIDCLNYFQTLNGLEYFAHFYTPFSELYSPLKRCCRKGLAKQRGRKSTRYYNNIYMAVSDTGNVTL